MTNTRGPFRADHVGSLQRPHSLAARGIQAENLCRRSSRAKFIAEAAEMRKTSACNRSPTANSGVRTFISIFSTRSVGSISAIMPEGPRAICRPGEGPFVAFITEKLSRPDTGIEVKNFKVVPTSHTTTKITVPSPTMTHFGRPRYDRDAYPDMDGFFDDLARVYRKVSSWRKPGAGTDSTTPISPMYDENMREATASWARIPTAYRHLPNSSTNPSRPPQRHDGLRPCAAAMRKASGSLLAATKSLLKRCLT